MAKNKVPPGFLFYPDNWLGGTMGWSFDLQGAYLNLLIKQWTGGPFSEAEAIQIVGKKRWFRLRGKFEIENSFVFNARLELERAKVQRYSDIQRTKANKKWMPRHNNGSPGGYAGGYAETMPLNLKVNSNNNNSNSDPNLTSPPDAKVSTDDNANISNDKITGVNVVSYEKTIQLIQQLKDDSAFLMVTANYIRLPGYQTGHHWVLMQLDRFLAHLQSEELTYDTRAELVIHFKNWLKFQKQPTPINNEIV